MMQLAICFMKNYRIPYNPKLKDYARELRKNSTLSEVLLWQKIKNKSFDVEFHRQVPLLEYIVDFYCPEIRLVIEVDGDSHEYKYDYDKKRQGALEEYNIEFIRLTDIEVKKEMFSIMLKIEGTIERLLNRP